MHDCDPRHFCLYEGLNLQPSKMPKSVVFREGGSGGGGVIVDAGDPFFGLHFFSKFKALPHLVWPKVLLYNIPPITTIPGPDLINPFP